jgi:hypothetical protein
MVFIPPCFPLSIVELVARAALFGERVEREVPIVDPAGPWLPKVPADSGAAPGDVDVL